MKMLSWLVSAIRSKIRYVYLRNPIRVFLIEKKQKQLLSKFDFQNVKNLIVFLTPGANAISGGILSIVSLCDETSKLKKIHNAEVFLCSLPGDPPIFRYTKFKNSTPIYQLGDVLRNFPFLKSVMIHIPEYAIDQFLKYCSLSKIKELEKIKNLQLNVMIQNIDAMTFGESVKKLATMGKVTGTTVHKSYSTSEIRQRFGHPIQRFSVFVSPEQYERKSYESKKDLMIISADPHPRKLEILKKLSSTFPKLEIVIIKKMSYEKYKELISDAKWALTFGEGLDNYLVEPTFCGGIGFGVYNDRFFTSDFKNLDTIYPNYNSLYASICDDIKRIDNANDFSNYQDKLYRKCAKHYDFREYKRNLENFYRVYFKNK